MEIFQKENWILLIDSLSFFDVVILITIAIAILIPPKWDPNIRWKEKRELEEIKNSK